MFGPALEAAEYAVASVEARIDRTIGASARLAIGRYLTVIAIGIPVAWVVCDFKFTRDGMLGIAAGVVLFTLLRPFTTRARKP
jgi:ABC-type Fe3+ transport system permease subunit